jgi:hypothetical protein
VLGCTKSAPSSEKTLFYLLHSCEVCWILHCLTVAWVSLSLQCGHTYGN